MLESKGSGSGKAIAIILLLFLLYKLFSRPVNTDAGSMVIDLNGDGRINILEIVSVQDHMGETGSPGWIPQDIDKNGVIDMREINIIKSHWTG